jgi:hypothetical protein
MRPALRLLPVTPVTLAGLGDALGVLAPIGGEGSAGIYHLGERRAACVAPQDSLLVPVSISSRFACILRRRVVLALRAVGLQTAFLFAAGIFASWLEA